MICKEISADTAWVYLVIWLNHFFVLVYDRIYIIFKICWKYFSMRYLTLLSFNTMQILFPAKMIFHWYAPWIVTLLISDQLISMLYVMKTRMNINDPLKLTLLIKSKPYMMDIFPVNECFPPYYKRTSDNSTYM